MGADRTAGFLTDGVFPAGLLDGISTFLADFSDGPVTCGIKLLVDDLPLRNPDKGRSISVEKVAILSVGAPQVPNRSRKSRFCPQAGP